MKNLLKRNDLLKQTRLKRQVLGVDFKSSLFILMSCLVIGLSQSTVAQNSGAQGSESTDLKLHTVLLDETLFAIAQRYGSTVDEIVDINQLIGQTIYVGQRLYVSGNDVISAQAPSSSTDSDDMGSNESISENSNGNSERPLTVERQGFYIVVGPGEGLLAIALRYGVPIGELANVNNIEDVTNISVGSSLYIPAPQNSLPVAQVVPVNIPVAEQLQTTAEGSGIKNIQIVASRHTIGGGSSPTTYQTYPSGPQVRIGVAPRNVAIPAPTYPTVVQATEVTEVTEVAVEMVETVVQPVGGFVPQDQSPKQKLLQQQMVLLRKSGPQLSIFQPPLQEFAWPLAVKGRISSNYGSRKLAITSNRFHYGLDLAASTGTSVKAAKSGVVKEADWIGGYGNAVYIDHPDGTQTRYAHMSKLNVAEGDVVAQGDIIGKVGSTGVSTGPHLHFEIRVKGYAVDPLDYIGQP